MTKVSILCATYNHEAFIKEALDSFLSQKTDFEFEIIVHDDASTDNTLRILRSYQKKYPNIFQLMTEDKNQVSQGNTRFLDAMFRTAKGTYIALCDGDDYWTDPQKLQTQADFLEKNHDYTLCFHPSKVLQPNKSRESIFPSSRKGKEFDLRGLLQGNYIHTSSVMYRAIGYPELRCDALPNDWYLHIFHAKAGKIKYIDKAMAVYRRHEQSAWWRDKATKKAFWEKNAVSHVKLYVKIMKMFENKKEYLRIVSESLNSTIRMIAVEGADKSNGNNQALKEVARAYPDYVASYITSISTQKERMTNKHIKNLEKINQGHLQYIRKLEDDYRKVSARLEAATRKLERNPIRKASSYAKKIKRKLG